MRTRQPASRHAAHLLLLTALAVPLSLVIGTDASLAQMGDASAEKHLGEVFSYFLKDGGIWRQDNSDHEAGTASPVAYIKRYRWGPGRAIVLDDTFALSEDGECKPWTHNVFHWDAAENVVRGQIFHHVGARFSGLIRPTGEHQTAAELSGTLPDGRTLEMRDTTDLSDPHRAVVTAFIANGDTWNESDQVAWVQVITEDKPCDS